MNCPTLIADLVRGGSPIVAAVVVVVFYSRNKKIDRRETINSEARAVYKDFLVSLESFLQVMCSDLVSPSEKDLATVEYRKALLALKVYGSDEVVKKSKPILMEIVRFTENSLEEPEITIRSDRIRKQIEDLVTAMRVDCPPYHWR